MRFDGISVVPRFVHVCQYILEDQTLSQERFATDILPDLLSLSRDGVPNVRITLARLLSQFILNSGKDKLKLQWSLHFKATHSARKVGS